MGYPTKIATCCYCGTRAALVLGRDRHELSCSNCGAPMHNLKRLPEEKVKKSHRAPVPSGHYMPEESRGRKERRHPPQRKRRKKRKSLMRYFAEEAFDVLEDIFD